MAEEKEIINDFNLKIGGEAGHGILNAGMMFTKACIRGGLYAMSTAIYPSLIRGGHNHLDVRISDKKIYANMKAVNLLIAMNKETFDLHKHKLTKGAGVIYDKDKYPIEEKELPEGKNIRLYHVPLFDIAMKHGDKIFRNTIALGASFAIVDFDLDLLNGVLQNTFEKKGEAVVQKNIAVAKEGYDYIKQNYPGKSRFKLKKGNVHGQLLMSGNEAISVGAVAAGCKFISAYPMTPASSILSNMAKWEKEYSIVVKQTEDELAAINMAIGANYSGVRGMTCTSGGGFALMAEGFGMAAVMETPLVVVEAQRPGPGTGMATQTGQGDLRFMLHASTDEFPRIVVAPGDLEQCFYLTVDAFNFAERYQIPVIVLTDKFLGESYWMTPMFDLSKVKIERGKLLKEGEVPKDYFRYKLTKDGVSPRAIPGLSNGMHVASSYEHSEKGVENEDRHNRVAMVEKRWKKFAMLTKEIPDPELIGDENAEITFISWGSTKAAIMEAMKELKEEEGIASNFLQLTYISPFPEKKVKEVLSKAKLSICVEGNQTGTLAGLIREHTGKKVKKKLLRFDGRPFFYHQIVRQVKEYLKMDLNEKDMDE